MTQKVLVVDDSLVMRTMVSLTLESAGFAVVEAHDGVEALEAVLGQGAPSLMVLDLNMPRLNGLELLQHLRASGLTGIPVLIVSSYASAFLDGPTAAKLGVKGFLTKPFKPEQLVSVARHLAIAPE